MQRLLCRGKADILAFYLELRLNNYISCATTSIIVAV
jgi:hypothetical protein